MINVSNEFKDEMLKRTDFKQYATITFLDGSVLELTDKDFTISNNSVTDGADANGIPLGVAVCRSIQIELMNDTGVFSSYDFFGAVIRLYLTFQLSNTIEKIEYGAFTVLTPETYGETVIITALDDMYKADKEYVTRINFPASIKTILVDACDQLGIVLGTTTFLNDDFVVDSMPEDITFRQLIGCIAMIAGGNARIDTTGRLRVISYDFDKISSLTNGILGGGTFSPWKSKSNLDGGTFNPWNIGDVADGGTFGDRNNMHFLSQWSDLKVDTDDVVITGIKTTYSDNDNKNVEVLYGTEGYVLEVENQLIVGKENDFVELVGPLLVGGRFRQFSGDIIANPTIEFMDTALLIDRKGNAYITIITDINFQFFGLTTLKNSADPTIRNSALSYSNATQTYIKAKKLVEKERTAREVAVEQLAKDLANSSGLYITTVIQGDGSSIYYMHDKPLLDESMIVWKLTALAFGISTDGGKTYPYGFSVDGTTITRLLYAEGINADYINTGAINITGDNGNIIFSADYDTKKVIINADNVMIGNQTVSGAISDVRTELVFQSGKIGAKVEKNGVISAINLTSESATIKAQKIDLIGLVNAPELVSSFATIDNLNSTTAYIEKLVSDKIDASVVKAEYMEVANWTSGGKIRADRIDANEIASRFSASTELRAGIIVGSSITTLGSFNVGNYSFSPQYSTTLHQYILIGTYIGA